jgi:hypothetical protein
MAKDGEGSWRAQSARNHPRRLGAGLREIAVEVHLRSVSVVGEINSDHSIEKK